MPSVQKLIPVLLLVVQLQPVVVSLLKHQTLLLPKANHGLQQQVPIREQSKLGFGEVQPTMPLELRTLHSKSAQQSLLDRDGITLKVVLANLQMNSQLQPTTYHGL